jgi:hypothetical protein
MERLTNRILEARTTYSYKQLKRWAIAFLPQEMSSPHSGVEREYTLDDAFTLLLGGALVAFHGFTLEDAKSLLPEILGALRATSSMPSETLAQGPEIIIEYGKTSRGNYRLELKKVLERNPMWFHKDLGRIVEAVFSEEPVVFGGRRGWCEPPRSLHITNLVRALLDEDDEEE